MSLWLPGTAHRPLSPPIHYPFAPFASPPIRRQFVCLFRAAKRAQVKIVGVEAGGAGIDGNQHSATLSLGTPGVLHGTRTYLLQDTSTGQIMDTHSISAGLDYPGVGPEHAWLKDSGRAEYIAVADDEAIDGFKTLCRRAAEWVTTPPCRAPAPPRPCAPAATSLLCVPV